MSLPSPDLLARFLHSCAFIAGCAWQTQKHPPLFTDRCSIAPICCGRDTSARESAEKRSAHLRPHLRDGCRRSGARTHQHTWTPRPLPRQPICHQVTSRECRATERRPRKLSARPPQGVTQQNVSHGNGMRGSVVSLDFRVFIHPPKGNK